MTNHSAVMAILWFVLAVAIGPGIVILFEITNPLFGFLLGFFGAIIPARIGSGYLFGDYD